MKSSKCLFALLIVGCMLTGAALAADSVTGKRYALLISVNDYNYLSDLRYCDNDMVSLRDALVHSGFEDNNVTLLHGGSARQELLPFRNNILEQLKVMLGGVKENDLLVVAFSGHGVHIQGKDYFCAADTKLEDPDGTMVSADAVSALLKSSKARQKVMIIDACRNDPMPEGTRSTSQIGMFRSVVGGDSTSGGFVVMRSCKAEQVSVEDPELQHGVFMNFVVNGLLGHADADRDNEVDLLELHRYADYETRNHVRITRSMLQTPTLALPGGELIGSYVMSKVSERPKKLDVQKVSTTTSSSAGPSEFEVKLYDSAYNLFQQGKTKDSIVAFEQLLKVAEDEQVKSIAKMKLASAYLSVDPVENISKALAVQPDEGVTVPVLSDYSIMSGKTKLGSVKAGQMVRITKVANGWHRVVAVGGEPLPEDKIGYIYKTALVAPKPKATSSSKPQQVVNNYGYGYGNSNNGGIRGVSGGGLPRYDDYVDHPADRPLAREIGRGLDEADRLYNQGKPIQGFLKEAEAARKAQELERRQIQRDAVRNFFRGGR
ncbi:MAG: caspase family protein [Pirellulaceae bacterium]